MTNRGVTTITVHSDQYCFSYMDLLRNTTVGRIEVSTVRLTVTVKVVSTNVPFVSWKMSTSIGA
jgi:hypothetical protein